VFQAAEDAGGHDIKISLSIDHHHHNPMAEPTKQETEQVFKLLKAQKANKASNNLRRRKDFSNNERI